MARNSVTSLGHFVDGYQEQPVWIGIDVHKRSYHVAILRADGKSVTFVSPPEPGILVRQLQELAVPIGGVTYEAGPTGFSLARALIAAGIQVFVAAASRIPRPVTAGAKTDRLDCLKLAAYVAKGLIKPIAIPTAEEEAQRSLLRRRHDIVDSIRRCKQRIKGFLLFLGQAEPREVEVWAVGAADALRALPVDPSARRTIESQLRELAFYQEELRDVAEQLRGLTRQKQHRKTVACLTSVPGVGPVVATTFLLELFRPERFHRAEEVSSYLGLAPMVRHSGEKSPAGRLVPVGQTRLRSLLIEAAWVWRLRDATARELYNRFLGRMGVAQKAIAALAHKLAIILWRLCLEQRPYRQVAM